LIPRKKWQEMEENRIMASFIICAVHTTVQGGCDRQDRQPGCGDDEELTPWS
jgi:hypothetical protein